ncbi:MAG: hypothetical protein GYA21_04185 [Myxococcales bacterium]|nr:hypothetical protein [Myxococcales bacterium]
MYQIDTVSVGGRQAPEACEASVHGALLGDFQDLEILLLQSAEAQRCAGEAIRKTNRAERRRMVEAAARAIEKAALWQIASAVSVSLVSLGAAVANLEGVPGKLLQACAAGWSKFNPLELASACENARQKRLDLAASEAGEAAQAGGELIASAREVERRMIDRLSELERTGSESRRAARSRG